MDTGDLLRAVKEDPIVSETFGSILPRDKLPTGKLRDFPRSYIVNTDSSQGPGKHWVAFYFENERSAEFFDSYGYKPLQLATEFETFLSRNAEHWIHNEKRLQGDFSTVCGQFCLLFLYHRCRGISMTDIIQMFSKDTDVNDVLVNEFVNSVYDGNYTVTDVEYLVRQIARSER